MLESMRNHAQSWMAKVILGGIALSFALWGVGDYFLGSRVEYVAEVDGKPIADSTFAQAYERQLNSYRAIFGKRFSKDLARQLNVKETTLQTLINRQLMLDEAYDMGLVAPEAALVASVQSNPAFQSATGFDPNRYQIITRNMGYRSTRDYEDEQRLNLMIDALQKAIIDSARVSDDEVRDRFNREFEKRTIAAVIIDPKSLESDITVTDKEARDYYDKHPEQYQSPLRVKLDAVEIDPKQLAGEVSVSDAELKQAYEDRKAEFTTPEQRHARHILVKLPATADEATKQAARKKIEAAAARIANGESFAKVATEVSEDITADKGGDLGWFARGTMVPAFDEAVFSMQKGEVSDVVETQFGLHLIKLEDVRPEKVKSFAEVRDTLLQKLNTEKASEEAYKLSQDLDDALGQLGKLQDAADSVNLKVRHIGPISSDEALANDLLGSDAKLRALPFSTMPGDAVNVIELDDGRFVAIEVLDHIEPKLRPYSEVAADAHADARHAAAVAKADKLAADLLSGAGDITPDAMAQSAGQPKYLSKPVRSNGVGDDSTWLTPSVIDTAFRTNSGTWAGKPVNTSRGLALVYVEKVEAPAAAELTKQRAAIRKEVQKSKGAVRFARWMASVRDRHEIVLHKDVIARF